MPEPADTTWTETTIASLRSKGHRNGGARRAVIELLGRQQCCLTAQEIFDQLRSEGRRVGTASVYRALEQLEDLGLVSRVEVGDGVSRFEPRSPDGHHHHHLVCDSCGAVEPFEDPALERAIDRLSAHVDFRVDEHEVLLHGACERCADAR
jgi:Fur family ferric uptake transcriptional regulator